MRPTQLPMRPVLLPLNMRSSERKHFVVMAFFLCGIIYVIADSFINLHHPRTHIHTPLFTHA